MKKLLLSIIFGLVFISVANAEAWIPDYGYFENKNEISAKKEVINNFNPDNIFDFNTSPNTGGEKIQDGKYYVPIMYNGGYNGTDTDYLYLDELKGADGKDGINGVDGQDGAAGPQGDKGDQGLQGVAGAVGQAGVDGLNGQDGAKGDTGATGAKGDNGKQGVKGDTGKGLEDRVEGIVEVRVLDTRKTTWAIYAGKDFNNDVNIIGAKVTVKLGRSYYEKKIDELEARLNKQEENTTNPTGEVYATDSGFGIREKF